MKKGLACMLACALSLAAQSPADSPAKPATTSEIEQLKKMLIDQQRQIDELKQMLSVPRNAHAGIGEVASTTPVLPPVPVEPPTFTAPAAASAPVLPPPAQQTAASESPLQFKLGDAYFTPVGFMDMTSVTRSTNPGSGIGTNFGSIPYGNTQAGALTESRLSPQNSRIGMRIDTAFKDFKVTGYWESDFLGQNRQPAQRRPGGEQQSICIPPAAVLGGRAEGQERISRRTVVEPDDAG